MIVTKTYNTICKSDKKNMKLKKIQPAMYDIIKPLSGSIHRDNGKMGILNGFICMMQPRSTSRFPGRESWRTSTGLDRVPLTRVKTALP